MQLQLGEHGHSGLCHTPHSFLLGHIRGQPVPCRFCGAPDHDGHLFWECTFPPLVEIRENPEFHDLMRLDKTHWPWCLLWHGLLPMLSGCNGVSPSAGCAFESAAYLVEVALGRNSSGLIAEWGLSDASSLPDHPDVWTDGSLVLDHLTGVSSSGSGFFAHHSEHSWSGRRWGHVDGIYIDPGLACCRGFSSVPGPLQSVQRAEMWGVILALQTSRAVHLGVDNLGVVRHVGRPLGGCRGSKPFELVNDGDLLLLIDRMLRRGVWTLFVFLKLKVMLMMVWFFIDKFGVRISWVMTLLMRLLILDGGGLVQPSLMLDETCLGFVVAGTLLFLIFIDSSLLFLVLWLIMMILVVLLLTLWFGLLVLLVKGVGWFLQFGTVPFCQGHLGFGMVSSSFCYCF